LVAVINARDEALFALRQLLNIEKNTELVLADPLSADGFRPVEENELATLVRNALETRASVRAAKRMAAIRESQVKQTRAAYY
ncbi:hypothetical protein H6A68_08835, partial [Bifidobacterium pullorum subsp. saeculare]|uniref:hypothetical protein n=1 Tax=Bifidobacterium pullorum TaxID=78448 RepID=UPI00195CB13C